MLALLASVGLVLVQLCLLIWVVAFLRQILLVQFYDSPPFIPTPKGTLATIAESLDLSPRDVVYELGSGDGRFLIYCAELEPAARYVGIERNPALVYLARVNAYLSGQAKNVTFRRESYHDTHLGDATKVYAFLLDSAMNQLLPKLTAEFHGRLASRAFTFQKKESTRVITLSNEKGAYGEHLLHVYDFH